jgi:hypothetical protein
MSDRLRGVFVIINFHLLQPFNNFFLGAGLVFQSNRRTGAVARRDGLRQGRPAEAVLLERVREHQSQAGRVLLLRGVVGRGVARVVRLRGVGAPRE